MTVEIYPNKLGGLPVEVFETVGCCTIHDWLSGQSKSYRPIENPPISIELNGMLIDPAEWDKRFIRPSDSVKVFAEPKGKAIGSVVAAVVGLIGVFIFQQKIPSIGSQSSGDGEDIALANAKANTAKVNSIIRESFGRRKIFPDYIVPPRKYFGPDPRDHWMEALVSVGVGRYDIQPRDILVGDTPLMSLGDSASFVQYNPGDDLSLDDASIWWHTSEEVGSTTASNGLELANTTELQQAADAEAYVLSGETINIPDAAGSFPEGWASGQTIRVESHLLFTVSGGNSVYGDMSELGPFVGMVVEIAGDNNAGVYKVASYAAGSSGVTGAPSVITGAGAPARYNFGASPATFSISFGVDSISVILSSDLSGIADLVSAINAYLPSSLTAANFGGVVRIIEVGPSFSGQALGASGTVSDVFGGTPISSTGTATEPAQDEHIALNFLDDTPATLAEGQFLLTIGYSGLRYRVVSIASEQLMTLERLTDAGLVDSIWDGFITRNDPAAEIVLDNSSAEGGWVGPFEACPENELTDVIEWDLLFSRGLGWINKKGNIQGHSVSMEMQWRDANLLGAWTSIIKTYNNSTLDQVGYTERTNLPYLMQPEVRMRRIGKQYSETVALDTIEWVGLKARMQSRPINYPDVTLISLKIKGGKALSAQSENDISVLATRMVPTSNPSLIPDFSAQTYESHDVSGDATWSPSRKIADFIKYAVTDIGYNLSDIDLDELNRLQAIWDARGDHCDLEITESGTLKDHLNDGLAAGFAELILERGKVTPVRDEAKDTVEHIYTPQNMTDALERKFSAIDADEYDGVDVTYTDEDTWEEETIECRLPGQLGERVQDITLKSVTNKTRAWRIGMRQAAADKWQRWRYRWGTELDGLNSRYGSLCGLADDVPGYSKSSLVKRYVLLGPELHIESSEPIDWAGVDFVALRKPDGKMAGPFEPVQIDAYRFSITSAVGFTPIAMGEQYEPTHILLGSSERLMFKGLVRSISPSSGNTVSLEAVNYDERVYQYDDASPDDSSDPMISAVLESIAKHDVFVGRNTGDIEFNA